LLTPLRSLDEASGIKRTADPLLLEVSQRNVSNISGSWNNFDRQRAGAVGDRPQGRPVTLLAARNVLRPQMKFAHLIDNSTSPFIPRLTEKPHSLKPLSILVEYDDSENEFYSHPYLYEMERFAPSAEQLGPATPVPPPEVEAAELVMVETVEQLRIAVAELARETVIGVDLEHHNYRSYLGITCLIQISTHAKDFIIDPLPLWAELTMLNEIMANPRIVKVMHGCDSDVEWLQRDFAVYLVNVFDTHQAGRLLGLPRLSLAWLLQNYCGLPGDKQFQLADWRIRPLPEAMVHYARQDTRHLGFLYARLRNDLLEKGNSAPHLLQAAIHQSNDLAKRRFHKPRVMPDSHLQLVRKARANLNSKQLWAAKELFAWRDKVGRVEDESTNYVLPNHMLLKIASELPREMQGILACCNPVPPLVKQNLGLLHTVILNARDQKLGTAEAAGVAEGPKELQPQMMEVGKGFT
jgi:exosome complex exonuclease RRP6